jgi:hypothetical protein
MMTYIRGFYSTLCSLVKYCIMSYSPNFDESHSGLSLLRSMRSSAVGRRVYSVHLGAQVTGNISGHFLGLVELILHFGFDFLNSSLVLFHVWEDELIVDGGSAHGSWMEQVHQEA